MPVKVKKTSVKKTASAKTVKPKKKVVTKAVAKSKTAAAKKTTVKVKKPIVSKAKASTKAAAKPVKKAPVKTSVAKTKKIKASAPKKTKSAVKTPVKSKPSVKKEKIVKKIVKPERSRASKSMKSTTKIKPQATVEASVAMATLATETSATTTSKRRGGDFSNLSFLGIAPYQEKAGEEYMNDLQLKHFQNILMAWKVNLMEEVDRTLHHMQDEAANYADPNDRASQEEEFSLELRARDRERKLTRKIEEGLKRIADKEYGYCDACGIEIGIRRLEARPTATLCIDCKTLDEIREKHMVS